MEDEDFVNLRTLIETDSLKIVTDGVESSRAVVSFTGIGHGLGGVQKEEFGKSLQDKEKPCRVYYVIDKRRSWYNSTHEQIKSVMERELAPFEDVTTLGNSMGGFGAIYFAGLFKNCQTVIAFCPQFSLMPGIVSPRDRRWMDYRRNISSWPVAHALEHAKEAIQYFICFGSREKYDRGHARQFLDLTTQSRTKARPNMHLFMIDGCSHDVAAFLKERQCLRSFLDAIIYHQSGPNQLASLLLSHGVRFHQNKIPFSLRSFF